MPSAPRYERQVTDAPFPNVRVSAAPTADTYGGQIGDTISNAGVRFYDILTRSANHTAVAEADRQLADFQTGLENELAQAKGKAALGMDQVLAKKFDDKVAELDAGLANDQQRGHFQQVNQLRRQQLNDSTQKYMNREFAAFQDDEDSQTIASSKDRIRRNPDSPTIVPDERARAGAAVDRWAERHGLIGAITPAMLNDPHFQQDYADRGQTPPTLEELKTPGMSTRFESRAYLEKKQIVESGLHKEVIDGLLAKDQDQAASAYLKANRQQFTAADLDAVEKNLETGSTRGESRRQASDLIATHGIETADQRRAALKAVDGIADDKVADATRQRLEHEFTVFDKRKEEDQSRRFELSAKVLDDQGLKRPNAMVEDMIPVPLLNTLDAKDRDALRLHLNRIRQPADQAHSPNAWFEFQSLTDTQLADVKPQDLMRTYLNRFDGTHYDRALTEWNAARNKQEKGDAGQKYVSALSNRERIKNAWTESNIVDNALSRSKWTAQDEVNYSRFESEADKALSALPKDAKPDEIQKVLHGLSDALLKQKYRVDPGLFRFNKDVPAIGIQDVTDARSIRIPLDQIPPARQDALKGALKQAGVPITTQAIEELEAKARLKKLGVTR